MYAELNKIIHLIRLNFFRTSRMAKADVKRPNFASIEKYYKFKIHRVLTSRIYSALIFGVILIQELFTKIETKFMNGAVNAAGVQSQSEDN